MTVTGRRGSDRAAREEKMWKEKGNILASKPLGQTLPRIVLERQRNLQPKSQNVALLQCKAYCYCYWKSVRLSLPVGTTIRNCVYTLNSLLTGVNCDYCQVKICSTAAAKSVHTAVGGWGIEPSSPWRYLPATIVQKRYICPVCNSQFIHHYCPTVWLAGQAIITTPTASIQPAAHHTQQLLSTLSGCFLVKLGLLLKFLVLDHSVFIRLSFPYIMYFMYDLNNNNNN